MILILYVGNRYYHFFPINILDQETVWLDHCPGNQVTWGKFWPRYVWDSSGKDSLSGSFSFSAKQRGQDSVIYDSFHFWKFYEAKVTGKTGSLSNVIISFIFESPLWFIEPLALWGKVNSEKFGQIIQFGSCNTRITDMYRREFII